MAETPKSITVDIDMEPVKSALEQIRTLYESAESDLSGLIADIEKVIADLDRARGNGTIYTYGEIQTRLRHALNGKGTT